MASSPLVSGQKIAGICEGKMRLCEARVKSGGSQQRTTTKMAVGNAGNGERLGLKVHNQRLDVGTISAA